MQQSNRRAEEKKKEVHQAQSEASDLKISIDSLREQLTEQKKKMDAHQAEGEKVSLEAQLKETQEQLSTQTKKSEAQQADAKNNSSLTSQLAEVKQQLGAEKEKTMAQEAQLMDSSSLKTELAEVKKQLSSEMAERQSQQQQQLLQEVNELKSSLAEVEHASLHIHTMVPFLCLAGHLHQFRDGQPAGCKTTQPPATHSTFDVTVHLMLQL